jgi:hypothetical protein
MPDVVVILAEYKYLRSMTNMFAYVLRVARSGYEQ